MDKIVCNEADLAENEMKEVDMGEDRKVLVIKQKGKITAIGAKCSHYGAPLVNGVLGEGRIRCPWHGACFNIETGDIEDFPGLDSLPCFDVSVDAGVVKIRAKKSDLLNDKRFKTMTKKDPRNGEIFAIVGGGPCAQTCVENLRQNGFKGRIIMICKEPYLPYDRIQVNKYANVKHEDIRLRSQEFYEKNDIEVFLNVEATALATSKREISLSSGNKLKYDKIFIATGSRAKQPEIPGNDLKNIFTLRNLDDAHKINKRLEPTAHVVILGSSFIALEAAAFCVDKAALVTIIVRNSVLFNNLFGEAIGDRIIELFKSKNVRFIMNSGIKSFYGKTENLESIELLNGKTMQADICIVGIGSDLNTDFLLDSELTINNDGSIDSNLYLETNV